ncbi:ATP-binding protein [Nocardioides litoris]|uniref:ATP-binding protein n=1 Tax=Nocardioides litoris TaxID=1926648 RepID=UPI0011237E7F|nr:ATP-binding protein [Nocardioides litoris]
MTDAPADTDSPFDAVAASAGLTPLEQRVLALCAAWDQESDRDVLLTLADVERELGPEAVDVLADDARLRSAGLVELVAANTFRHTQVTVPRRVAWALRDDLSLDPELSLGTELVALPPDTIGTADLVLVHGSDAVRRQQRALAALAPTAFLITRPPADDRSWRVLVRQATVLGVGVVLDVPATPDPATRHWVERADHLAWGLLSERPLDVGALPRRPYIELAAEPAEVASAEWRAVFPEAPVPARVPTASQLRAVASVADNVQGAEARLRRVTTGTLLKHATRIVPKVGWDDLVLPESQERQLRALIDRYRQRSRVHDDWGLSLYPSPGVVALFSGPSGTGKTTSAEVIAHELGMDMFRVDLSALVSKYIGETEKNLEEIFSAAHTGNYLLLFDEADSLFGSRSKVEDSKDRYANMEVSYLLQRLETYDGVVVLTSNFQGNIDQAFLRRIHVTVHFPVPSAEERERIWDRALGRAPRLDLDLGFVAEQFDLTGGSIRNAALTAAFTAAARAEDPEASAPVAGIDMVDLLRAVSTEMTKLGRRPQDAQFGTWLGAVFPQAPHPRR